MKFTCTYDTISAESRVTRARERAVIIDARGIPVTVIITVRAFIIICGQITSILYYRMSTFLSGHSLALITIGLLYIGIASPIKLIS